MRRLQPPGWPEPRGYANGIAASGELVFVAGQIGWDETGAFPHDDLAGQVGQALRNIVAVLAEAGAGPEHVARMTWYITSRDEYLADRQGDRRRLPRRHGPPFPGHGGRRGHRSDGAEREGGDRGDGCRLTLRKVLLAACAKVVDLLSSAA